MRKYLLLTIAATMMFAIGCSTPAVGPKQYTFKKTITINKSYDEVWNKIISMFGENNISIRTIEKASGIIATEHSYARSGTEDCDCGVPRKPGFGESEFSYVHDNLVSNFNITVRKISETSTSVTANVFYKCRLSKYRRQTGYPYEEQYFGTEGTVECNSTGKFEKRLFDYLEGK